MDRKGFLHKILFLDIETVPLKRKFEDLSVHDQFLFEKKSRYQRKDVISPSEYYENAGIWAEFGKIICISTVYVRKNEKGFELVLKSFYGHKEHKILQEFNAYLNQHFNGRSHLLCAHNGKEFDFPYLARRMIINQIPLPDILDLFGKKPWQIRHIDTMDLWKFGDYKHYTSLDLMTSVLGIPSPKVELMGKDVRHVYYEKKDLERIVQYCEKDVISVLRVFLRLKGYPKGIVRTNSQEILNDSSYQD